VRQKVAEPFRHVDLCSGIGGFALGFQWAGLSRPVLFCDIEDWSRKVLAKHWPDVPIAEDVKELASDPRRLVPDCDILSCGYPCQPFSQAGVRRGEEDDRHIWPEIFTIVQAKRPSWCVFENVSGHISLGLDQVLSDLEGENYAIQPFVVPACAVDAPHRRDRVWIIAAHADSDGEPVGTIDAESGCWQLGASDVGHAYSSDICRHDKTAQQGWRQQGLAAGCQDVADAYSERLQGQWSESVRVGQKQCDAGDSRRRLTKSSVGGMADGLSTWLDEPRDIPRVATGVKQRAARLKGLGNAIVPQIAMQIGLTIKAVENG
jgi:DNA (cytosine-5)-methyltransferase 1